MALDVKQKWYLSSVGRAMDWKSMCPWFDSWRYHHKTSISNYRGFFCYIYMHYLYIIYSPKVNKFYVGETDNIALRLLKHNNHSYEGSFTKIAEDWEVVMSFECSSKSQSLSLEKFIKRMKSKIFIQKIIENPKILDEIISKNKL